MPDQNRTQYADLAGISEEIHFDDAVACYGDDEQDEWVCVAWDKKTERCYTYFGGDTTPDDCAETLEQYAPEEL